MSKRVLLSSLAAAVLAIGASAAVSEYDVAVTGAIDITDGNTLEDNFKTYGLRANKRMDENYLLGLAYERADNVDYQGLASSTDLNRYFLNLFYEFTPQEDSTPYLLGGVGYQDVEVSNNGFDNGTLGQLGVGWKTSITDYLDFLLEGRWIRDFKNEANDIALTAGLSLPIGKEAKPAPAPQPVPEPAPQPKDSDNDGVYDNEDQCPNTPMGIAVNPDGCPPDSDGDGVYDYKDQCPNTPLGTKVDSVGCPLDSDGDGVVDTLDRCPDTPQGVAVDKNGCPIIINLNINFDFNSAKIKPEYMPKLEAFAEFMKKNPKYKAEIQGHTDSIGSAAYNKKLSEARAKAVYEALIKLGVSKDRLSYIGYGEEKPIADNSTKEGRAKNRRVEAHLYY